MKKKKVMVVFGTRPEAIKMCPVIVELKKRNEINCCVCLTGQHRQMLLPVIELFHIRSDYNLDIMKQNQTLAMILISIVKELDEILENEKPDLVLVHGDTSSSFAAAISSFYHHIPIGHVEAGLRTFDMKSPFPEEFNRQAVDMITDLYFAPTQKAKNNLLQEGKAKDKIFVTGNTVIDALKTTVDENYDNEDMRWVGNSKLILLTVHRRENIGIPMENIFRAVNRIVDEYRDVKVIYPIHKNPKVREIANFYLKKNDRIKLIEPLDVYDFHNYMKRSYLIMTDSGGIQEEAPTLGKPVLVMRDTTERPEGVEAGTLKLVGTNEETVYQEVKLLLDNTDEYCRMSSASNPYGDGHASQKIVDIILQKFMQEK